MGRKLLIFLGKNRGRIQVKNILYQMYQYHCVLRFFRLYGLKVVIPGVFFQISSDADTCDREYF